MSDYLEIREIKNNQYVSGEVVVFLLDDGGLRFYGSCEVGHKSWTCARRRRRKRRRKRKKKRKRKRGRGEGREEEDVTIRCLHSRRL